MNTQEMLQHFADQAPRERKPRVQFGKVEAWRDCHGTHRSVDIWYGGDVCGEIVGGSSIGAMTEYWVKFGGKTVSPTLYSMKEAKAWARNNLFKS